MSNITQKWVYTLFPYLESYSSRLSESEIARRSGVPQQTVSRILNKFVDSGLINYEIRGRNKLFYFTDSLESKILFETLENFKGLDYSSSEPFPIVEEILEHCEGVIIFGKNLPNNKSSSIDLIVLGECNKNKINKLKQKSSVEINEHYFDFSEFRDLLNRGEKLVLQVLENHLIFGNVSKIVDLFWRYQYRENEKIKV